MDTKKLRCCNAGAEPRRERLRPGAHVLHLCRRPLRHGLCQALCIGAASGTPPARAARTGSRRRCVPRLLPRHLQGVHWPGTKALLGSGQGAKLSMLSPYTGDVWHLGLHMPVCRTNCALHCIPLQRVLMAPMKGVPCSILADSVPLLHSGEAVGFRRLPLPAQPGAAAGGGPQHWRPSRQFRYPGYNSNNI